MRQILFDIDGTLISTGRAGSQGMLAAIREITGVQEPTTTNFHGRTDSHLLPELLRVNGIEPTETLVSQARDRYFMRLGTALENCDGKVLDGIVPLLDRLLQQTDLALGLLTGNFPHSAEMKLSYYGIWDRFRFGFFGDISPDRNDLAREAWRQLSAEDPNLTKQDVWIVGDTPLDVACAKVIDARCLACCTGGCTSEELHNAGADYVIDDFEDVDGVFDILTRG